MRFQQNSAETGDVEGGGQHSNRCNYPLPDEEQQLPQAAGYSGWKLRQRNKQQPHLLLLLFLV